MILPFILPITWNKYIFRQYMLAIAVTIDVILLGAGYTFSATLLPQLDENLTIEITKNEKTWIASLSSLSCVPGSLGGCFLLQIFGRKWSYVIIAMSNALAWGLLASSTQIWHFLAGRALQGFNAGLGYAVIFCYIVEVFDIRYRAVLLNLVNVGAAIGMLFVDTIGSYYSYTLSAYILTALCVIYLLIFLYLQNTHVWYLQRGDKQRARDYYFWYKEITTENEDNFNADVKLADITVTLKELIQEYQHREFYIPLLIVLWFNTTIMSTGGFGIMLYSVDIMKNVVSIDEYIMTIVIDVLRLLSTFGTGILISFTSVRFIVNMSSIFCTVSLLITALSMWLKVTWYGWDSLALIAILIFNFFFNLGYVNLGNICIGELFTGIGKSSGTAIAGMYFFLLYFSFGHLVPAMFDNLNQPTCFIIFGMCTLVGGAGLYFIMPETKGLSNIQIRELFNENSNEMKDSENHISII